jgi:hypothetical protein
LAKEGRRQGTKGVMNRRTRMTEPLQGEGEREMNRERNEDRYDQKRDGIF